jgi:RHS repeat-associated protein
MGIKGAKTNRYQYNGIELNSDFGLDISMAFFRGYDAAVGRWWQIDPKPNASESPYCGMSNNPIKLTDPFGDTVLVRHGTGFLGLGKKEILAYADGKLSNRDGSNYTGKVKGFLKNVVGALDKINSKSNGQTLLDKFEGKKNVLIQKGSENSTINSKGSDRAFSTKTINYSGSSTGGPDVNGSDKRPNFVGLAHELGHAESGMFGGSIIPPGVAGQAYDPTNPDANLSNVSKDEYNAVDEENKIRTEHGVPLREYYTKDASGAGFMPFLQPGTKNNIITGKPY